MYITGIQIKSQLETIAYLHDRNGSTNMYLGSG